MMMEFQDTVQQRKMKTVIASTVPYANSYCLLLSLRAVA